MSKIQQPKYHLRKRIFLNRDMDMRAFAIAIVEDTREVPIENDNHWKWGDIQLNLGDCTRHVSFDFDLSSKENRRNSLHKVRKIAEIISAFREAIETEAASIEARQAKIELETKQQAKQQTKAALKSKSAAS